MNDNNKISKEMPETMTIFKMLRLMSGLSGKRFATVCGISYPYWNELESGAKENPSRKVINQIADACGLKAETLWYLAGSDHPKTAEIHKMLMNSIEEYVRTVS